MQQSALQRGGLGARQRVPTPDFGGSIDDLDDPTRSDFGADVHACERCPSHASRPGGLRGQGSVRRRAQAAPPSINWDEVFAPTASAPSTPSVPRRHAQPDALVPPAAAVSPRQPRQHPSTHQSVPDARTDAGSASRANLPLCSLLGMPSLDRQAFSKTESSCCTSAHRAGHANASSQPLTTLASHQDEPVRQHGTIVYRCASNELDAEPTKLDTSPQGSANRVRAPPPQGDRPAGSVAENLQSRILPCPKPVSFLKESVSMLAKPLSRVRRGWESRLHPRGSAMSEPSTPLQDARTIRPCQQHSVQGLACKEDEPETWDSVEEEQEAERFATELMQASRGCAARREDQAHTGPRSAASAWTDDFVGVLQPDVPTCDGAPSRGSRAVSAGSVTSERCKSSVTARRSFGSREGLGGVLYATGRRSANDADDAKHDLIVRTRFKELVADFEEECKVLAGETPSLGSTSASLQEPANRSRSWIESDDSPTRDRREFLSYTVDGLGASAGPQLGTAKKTSGKKKISRMRRSSRESSVVRPCLDEPSQEARAQDDSARGCSSNRGHDRPVSSQSSSAVLGRSSADSGMSEVVPREQGCSCPLDTQPSPAGTLRCRRADVLPEEPRGPLAQTDSVAPRPRKSVEAKTCLSDAEQCFSDVANSSCLEDPAPTSMHAVAKIVAEEERKEVRRKQAKIGALRPRKSVKSQKQFLSQESSGEDAANKCRTSAGVDEAAKGLDAIFEGRTSGGLRKNQTEQVKTTASSRVKSEAELPFLEAEKPSWLGADPGLDGGQVDDEVDPCSAPSGNIGSLGRGVHATSCFTEHCGFDDTCEAPLGVKADAIAPGPARVRKKKHNKMSRGAEGRASSSAACSRARGQKANSGCRRSESKLDEADRPCTAHVTVDFEQTWLGPESSEVAPTPTQPAPSVEVPAVADDSLGDSGQHGESLAQDAENGSLGTMLQEMAVAVARLDATLYVDNCQVAKDSATGNAESSANLSNAGFARNPGLVPVQENIVCGHAEQSSASVRSSGESEYEASQSKVRSKRASAKQESVSRGGRESRRHSRASDASRLSTYCAGSATSVGVVSKRSAARSTASTATSMASEASCSEIISDDDASQSISGPPSLLRAKNPAMQRPSMLDDFFASKPEVPLDITNASLRVAAHASLPCALAPPPPPAKESAIEGNFSSLPPQPRSRLSGVALGRRESAKRAPPPKPASECALCGGPSDGGSGSCFCSACAARLQVLGPTSQADEPATALTAATPKPKDPQSSPLLAKTEHVDAAPSGEVSTCVLCSSRFVCSVDASSSVLCPTCLGANGT